LGFDNQAKLAHLIDSFYCRPRDVPVDMTGCIGQRDRPILAAQRSHGSDRQIVAAGDSVDARAA